MKKQVWTRNANYTVRHNQIVMHQKALYITVYLLITHAHQQHQLHTKPIIMHSYAAYSGGT